MASVTDQWIERAKYDLGTAKALIKMRRYLYAAFMCQQAIEKLLKAILANQGKTAYPIHNLLRLADEASLLKECTTFDDDLLAELTPFCIKARYGEYKQKLSELCNKKMAVNLFTRTQRMFRWLLKKI